jgi:hypothetical protein
MANQRFTPTNVGRNAVQNEKERLLARRQGGPFAVNVPEGNNAIGKARQSTFDRRMNGFGRQQVPPEMNTIDRDLERRVQRAQQKAQEG